MLEESATDTTALNAYMLSPWIIPLNVILEQLIGEISENERRKKKWLASLKM